MRTVLHLIHGDPGEAHVLLAEQVIHEQRQRGDLKVTVIHLGSQPADYVSLVDALFEADSIQTW